MLRNCPVVALAFVLVFCVSCRMEGNIFVAEQTKRVAEHVALLKGQSLAETFVALLDNEQYFYPGYHPEAEGAPREMEELLSSRGFLKVLQQFGELPKEQAAEKILVFRERSLSEFENALEKSAARAADPLMWNSETMEPIPTPNIMGAKYMAGATMLLAARIGEHEMLIDMIKTMQSLADSHIERVREFNASEPGWDSIYRAVVSLEDDFILSVLMYALWQKGAESGINIPLDQKTIPLFRWDAELTYYDVLAQRGLKRINTQDAIELFAVYAFPKNVGDQQKRQVISSLKERLSR